MALPRCCHYWTPERGQKQPAKLAVGQDDQYRRPDGPVTWTRDRVSTIMNHDDRYFELVDTGGYGIVDSDALRKARRGAGFSRRSAPPRWFCSSVDIREGITPLDQKIAQMIRKHDLKIILVANKADTARQESGARGICAAGIWRADLRLGAEYGQPVGTAGKAI